MARRPSRADVENRPRPAPPRDGVKHQQATARRAVVAGAEGQRRVDLDGDIVEPETWSRLCEPCTMKRPARTGFSPSRDEATQSFASMRPNVGCAQQFHRRRLSRSSARRLASSGAAPK